MGRRRDVVVVEAFAAVADRVERGSEHAEGVVIRRIFRARTYISLLRRAA
jgi:hypothetical protein